MFLKNVYRVSFFPLEFKNNVADEVLKYALGSRKGVAVWVAQIGMGVRSIPVVHSKLSQEVGCYLDLRHRALSLDPAESPKYLGNLRIWGTGERRPQRCSVRTPVSPFSALPLNLSLHTVALLCPRFLAYLPMSVSLSPCPACSGRDRPRRTAGWPLGPRVVVGALADSHLPVFCYQNRWLCRAGAKLQPQAGLVSPHRMPAGAPLLMLNSLLGPLVSDPLRRCVRCQFIPGLSTSSPVFQLCR